MYSKEVGAFSRAIFLIAPNVLCVWRTPSSGVVSSCRMLYFDDLCSMLKQLHQYKYSWQRMADLAGNGPYWVSKDEP